MCDSASDFSGVKVGDRLWDMASGPCVVSHIGPSTISVSSVYVIGKQRDRTYFMDGTLWSGAPQSLFWSRPEIIAPPKPRRKVTKTVEMDVRVDRFGAVHRIRKGQGIPPGNHRVHLTGTYEVEE